MELIDWIQKDEQKWKLENDPKINHKIQSEL